MPRLLRNLAIQSHARFERDKWQAGADVFCKCLVELSCLDFERRKFFASARIMLTNDFDLYAGLSKPCKTIPADPRVWIAHQGNHARHFGRDYCIRARRRPSLMRTGLQVDVERATLGARPCFPQCDNLSVIEFVIFM